jgi:hypothetical protein
MRLQLLQVPGCPGAEALARRLADAPAAAAEAPAGALASAEIHLDRLVVADPEQATTLGMTGSPTLLVDGIDPFPAPARPAGLSCRLYPDEHGRPGNAPTTGQLRAALQAVQHPR